MTGSATGRCGSAFRETDREGLDAWKRKIRTHQSQDEKQLRTWLARRNVIGYAQQLLAMERFGYPDFILASADELIDRQYADAPSRAPSTMRL